MDCTDGSISLSIAWAAKTSKQKWTPADDIANALKCSILWPTDFYYLYAISATNEAAVLTSVIDDVKWQLNKYPNTEDDNNAALIKDKSLSRLLYKDD